MSAAAMLALSACNNGSDVVVETKAGNITKDELYNEMKERFGKDVLRDLVHEKVLSKNLK